MEWCLLGHKKRDSPARVGSRRAEWECSAVRAGPPRCRRCSEWPHDENKRFLAEKFITFQTHFLYILLLNPVPVQPKNKNFLLALSVRVRFHRHMAAGAGCRGAIWFTLEPQGVHLLLTTISPMHPHRAQLHAFVSYLAQDVTHLRLMC